MRILVAEDEVSIAKALGVMLKKNKYTVDIVHNGIDALYYIGQYSYDTLVLDIMMPQMDGIELVKKIRSMGNTTPVLFLTAKGEISDRVAGLDAGADDYLPKPFASSEFLARVRDLTRRNSNYTPDILSFGNISLDCNRYILSINGESVRLNNKEFQLIQLFIKNPHQVFSTERLMELVWGFDCESELDVVWTYIGFLRKKLKTFGANVEIKTMRGIGYALEEIKC